MTDETQHRSPLAGWRSGTALALWTGLAVIALVLAWRRLAGAFAAPDDGLPAFTFATLAAGAGIMAWILDRAPTSGAASRLRRAVPVVVTLLPVLVLGAALCPARPSATVAYLTVLGLLTAAALWTISQSGAESAATSRSYLPAMQPTGTAAAANGAVSRREGAGSSAPPGDELHTGHASNGSEQHGSLSHWVRRETLRDGTEQIEGGLRVAFAAGQKHASVHVVFSPPLAQVPAIECEPLDTADVQLKVAAAYAYGARIEARRDGPVDLPIEAQVGYTASAPAALGSMPRG